MNCDEDNIRGISGSKDHSGSIWNLDRDDFVDYSLIGHSDYIVIIYNNRVHVLFSILKLQ